MKNYSPADMAIKNMLDGMCSGLPWRTATLQSGRPTAM